MQKKRIWITGASRGIGLETAKILAGKSAALFLSARTIESFKNVMSTFKKYDNIFIMPCDVSNSKEVNKIYSKIEKSHGGVDILINNAGVGIFRSFLETSEEDFDRTIATNLKGAFLCSKAVLPDMIKNKTKGCIINILSVATQTTFEGTAIYSASKSALLSMDRVMRNEIRKHGIKVIDIMPGATESDMWDKETRKKLSDRMMQPSDLAKVIYNMILLNQEDRLITEEVLIRPIGGDL